MLARLVPRFREDAERDPPVAPIRALAANGCDPARFRKPANDRIGDGTPRPLHQCLDLALNEIFPNCTVYSVWCVSIGYLIFHDKRPSVRL